MASEDAYAQLISFLDGHGVPYRLIDHEAKGRTEIVSGMRGNALSQAAKCILLMVKVGKKSLIPQCALDEYVAARIAEAKAAAEPT